MEPSKFVTVTFPGTHADTAREAIEKAGAGKMGNYSCSTFSFKGKRRFIPDEKANPDIEEIKKAHPYEETVIDIYPIYEIGSKKKGIP